MALVIRKEMASVCKLYIKNAQRNSELQEIYQHVIASNVKAILRDPPQDLQHAGQEKLQRLPYRTEDVEEAGKAALLLNDHTYHNLAAAATRECPPLDFWNKYGQYMADCFSEDLNAG